MVKRYRLSGPGWKGETYCDSADMEERPDGEFVLYEDYEKLQRAYEVEVLASQRKGEVVLTRCD